MIYNKFMYGNLYKKHIKLSQILFSKHAHLKLSSYEYKKVITCTTRILSARANGYTPLEETATLEPLLPPLVSTLAVDPFLQLILQHQLQPSQ